VSDGARDVAWLASCGGCCSRLPLGWRPARERSGELFCFSAWFAGYSTEFVRTCSQSLTGKKCPMYSAVLIFPSGVLKTITVYSPQSISAILCDPHVDCLTSADGLVDFWFGLSSTEHRPNRQATEFLLRNSGFTARTVPLLRGSVIVCSRTVEGRVMGLTATDLERLRCCSWPSRLGLAWRFKRAQRTFTSRAGEAPVHNQRRP
jgi:hypothetical protein